MSTRSVWWPKLYLPGLSCIAGLQRGCVNRLAVHSGARQDDSEDQGRKSLPGAGPPKLCRRKAYWLRKQWWTRWWEFMARVESEKRVKLLPLYPYINWVGSLLLVHWSYTFSVSYQYPSALIQALLPQRGQLLHHSLNITEAASRHLLWTLSNAYVRSRRLLKGQSSGPAVAYVTLDLKNYGATTTKTKKENGSQCNH